MPRQKATRNRVPDVLVTGQNALYPDHSAGLNVSRM